MRDKKLRSTIKEWMNVFDTLIELDPSWAEAWNKRFNRFLYDW